GEDRSVVAAEMAVSSPLLEASIDGAHGVLLSIAGGSDLGLFEINEAAALVSQAAHAEANIIFGATIDDALGDEVRVTVIAAGFDGGMPKRRDQHQPALRREQNRQSSNGQQYATQRSASPQPAPQTQQPAQQPTQPAPQPAAGDEPPPNRPQPSQPRQPAPEREPAPAYYQRPREERPAEPQRPTRQPRPVEFDDPNELDVPDFLK
ncbi:MAG: cell division protein FtsZ, partial [Nocardioidaceae bacterium]